LITLALIAGMVGCGDGGGVEYDLTITSTSGGSVTIPGEETFTYDEGTVVNLTAQADEGYQFVNWTGDVGTIDDTNDATTTITMNGDYYITANFLPDGVEPLWDWYDLNDIRYYLDGNYALMNDLDSTAAGYEELASQTARDGKGWQPIGNLSDQFIGALEGQGYKIRELFINRPDELFVGLFSYVDVGGFVQNVGVVNVSVAGQNVVGGLVGFNEGTVRDSYSSGSVTGFGAVGGLVGANEGTVRDSHSSGSATGLLVVGGLVGKNFGGNVTNSYSSANVAGEAFIGGLVGANEGTVRDSHSSGSATGYDYVGGLVGHNSGGNVTSSYATGRVTGLVSVVGGLVGANVGNVTNSYATGSVTGGDYVGGLVGQNEGTGTVNDSYATGSVTGNVNVGGLVGENEDTVTDSFWDIETSGQTTSDGGTGKNTTEMQNIITFSGAMWNIIGVINPTIPNPAYTWNIVDDVTYPFLSWQPVS
jgi:hypothetical protein